MYLIIRSFFYDKNNKVTTRIIRLSLVFILLIIFATIFYGSFIEPQRIKRKTTDINLATTEKKEKIKIIFISDIHAGPNKKTGFVKKIVKLIEQEKPDLILFGGDFIYWEPEHGKYISPLALLLPTYKDRMFTVFGNHEFNLSSFLNEKYFDKTTILREELNKAGIKILENQGETITIDNNKIFIAGIKELWTGQADANKPLENLQNKNIIKILLAHNPDIILDKNSEKYNLILSGHTHAGQIRLPWIGAVPSLPTELGKTFDRGLFKLKQGYLYISAGIGETGTRARLFNRPEFTIINLDL